MSQILHAQCVTCDTCVPRPPQFGAIDAQNPSTPNDFQTALDLTLHPRPNPARSRKCQAVLIAEATPPHADLFANGDSCRFASSMVIWETCNVLSQQASLPWQSTEEGRLLYEKPVKHGRGYLAFSFTQPWREEVSQNLWDALDLRAACVHLIYAACAAQCDRPWEQEFAIDDRQLAEYLGLNRRKDLSKLKKLALIKYLGQLPCRLNVSLSWPQQGNVAAFTVADSNIWHLLGVQHHIRVDGRGRKSLVGLTFRIRAGNWAKYFLNPEGRETNGAFYQYGNLPKVLLQAVMRIWQKHEGAARMMLWLLFKTKVGRLQPIAVSTLMTVAYGSAKLRRSETDRAYRKKQIRTFEKDLEVLHEYHFDAVFDPNSYPPDIQPLWAKLLAVPEESEAEFEFWVDDAGKERRLTDPSPRGKWSRLMKARILQFQLPSDLDRGLSQLQKQQQRKSRRTSGMPDPIPLSPEQIAQFRRLKGWSQRELARQIGKSQSWVRDVEKGRLRVKPEDGRRLQELLDSEGFEASP